MQTATLAFISGVLAAAALVAGVAAHAEDAADRGVVVGPVVPAVVLARPAEPRSPDASMLAVRSDMVETGIGRPIAVDGLGMDRFRIGDGPLFQPLPKLPIVCDHPMR
jgi:hypothetical protein